MENELADLMEAVLVQDLENNRLDLADAAQQSIAGAAEEWT